MRAVSSAGAISERDTEAGAEEPKQDEVRRHGGAGDTSLAAPERKTMPRRHTTQAGMLGDIQILIVALAANGEDLPHLETSRAKLEKMLGQAYDAATQQANAAAVKQEATKQLQTLRADSTRLGNALRAMIKEHYGVRSEKLAEFGIQPFRGRPRKGKGEGAAE